MQYTGQNKGKFRLVETQAPAGYIGGWKKDISILDMEQDFTLKAENTLARLPYGEITVTKKILEKDIIWAHGNPVFRFIITGKDQRGMEHSYENYVEFEKGNYNKQDDYAILSCTISRIPLGRYTISEKETLSYSSRMLLPIPQMCRLQEKTELQSWTEKTKRRSLPLPI